MIFGRGNKYDKEVHLQMDKSMVSITITPFLQTEVIRLIGYR